MGLETYAKLCHLQRKVILVFPLKIQKNRNNKERLAILVFPLKIQKNRNNKEQETQNCIFLLVAGTTESKSPEKIKIVRFALKSTSL